MSAWGVDAFGNDTACDWKYDLEDQGHGLIEATLRRVVNVGGDYLEAPEAEEAIAAADTLARLRGHFYERNAYTESLDAWVAANPFDPPEPLLRLAAAALARIRGDQSELHELWAESDHLDDWNRHLDELAERLT